MNTSRLHEILTATTVQFRKGEKVETRKVGPMEVTEVFAMPHQNEAPSYLVMVDLDFLMIGVDKDVALKYKDELVAILREWPEPDRLAAGPSYIEVGGVIGDQGAAFQLFALGEVLELWNTVTPTKMGFTGEAAREVAGRGYIMMSGFAA